jgi:hypothetical protein
VARIADDRFRIFISHKHDDHGFADTVAKALGGLTGTIECFVSGSNIDAGTDWNEEIRQALARSHLLLLLFTSPSQNWDWCLYEAGLYTRFQDDDVASVVSLYPPDGSAPRPLGNLQGVPASTEKLEAFLTRLCRETWRVSDDWLRGPLARQVKPAQIKAVARRIAEAFPTREAGGAVYHPCHRVVLDLAQVPPSADRIPEDARVVEGPGGTTAYTLSLFRAASGTRAKTWGELLAAVHGQDAAWRHQLDRRYAAALREELFRPTTATLRGFDPEQRLRRYYRPVLYEVVCTAPCFDGDGEQQTARRVQRVTVVFDPQLAPAKVGGPAFNLVRINARFASEVFEVFCGTVAQRSRSGAPVFDEIEEAFDLIYEEAEGFGLFESHEIEQIYGVEYASSGVETLGGEWDALRLRLAAALGDRDAAAVEQLLGEMRELNRRFSLAAAERYLATLEPVERRSSVTG